GGRPRRRAGDRDPLPRRDGARPGADRGRARRPVRLGLRGRRPQQGPGGGAGARGAAARAAWGDARMTWLRRRVLGAAVLAAALVSAVARPALAGDASEATTLRNDAIAAYNAQNYPKAASLAARWLERAIAEGKTGREYAALQFIAGHARYEMHQKEGGAYAGDYKADVVTPIEESLRVLQDDPAFKNMLLGNAY